MDASFVERGSGMDYKEEIVKLLDKISDGWILKQIYRFIVNITKEV